MRTAFRGVALLALLGVLAASPVFGDDYDPNQPPEARINPPGGVTSTATVSPDARINPPIGTSIDLLIEWLWLYVQIA